MGNIYVNAFACYATGLDAVQRLSKKKGFLADAEQALEDCSSCLARDVIVSETQATEHNRSIVNAKDALFPLRRQIRGEHEEVCTPHNCAHTTASTAP